MHYEMEELLPIVAKLTEKYTGLESTSVTYEKAEQLMEAVLYCIAESTESSSNTVMPTERMTARLAYEIGYSRVLEKVRLALSLYHDILHDFTDYGNHCLHDTVIKGIPEFFKWYDAEFCPQNTILMLDYPVLKDLSSYEGIDRIYTFLSCVRLEKLFLEKFPKDYVISTLRGHDSHYPDMVENICEIIYATVLGYVLIQKPLEEQIFREKECWRLREIFSQTDIRTIRNQIEEATTAFVEKYYGGHHDLCDYLTSSIDNILVRMKIKMDVFEQW